MKMQNNPAKYEVLIKQYLRSILDISGAMNTLAGVKHHSSTGSHTCDQDDILEGKKIAILS